MPVEPEFSGGLFARLATLFRRLRAFPLDNLANLLNYSPRLGTGIQHS